MKGRMGEPEEGGILEDIEYLGRDLRLVAGGRIPRRRILRTGLLYRPPVVVGDRECPGAWCAVLICLHGGATGTITSPSPSPSKPSPEEKW